MAGAGIGMCIVCGRDGQALVSDMCPECTMKEFWLTVTSGSDSIAAIASDHEKYRRSKPILALDYLHVEVCPKGHVGRGILLEAEPIEAANGDLIERHKFECELCGEIWWENL